MPDSPACLLLTLLRVSDRGLDPPEHLDLPPGRVCYRAWNPDRLKEALRLLDQGSRPPPIRVDRVVGLSDTLYLVSSGNHRAAAAEKLGLTVPAEVVGEFTVDPGLFFLLPAGAVCVLWRALENGTAEFVSAGFSPKQIAALVKFGVRNRGCWQ